MPCPCPLACLLGVRLWFCWFGAWVVSCLECLRGTGTPVSEKPHLALPPLQGLWCRYSSFGGCIWTQGAEEGPLIQKEQVWTWVYMLLFFCVKHCNFYLKLKKKHRPGAGSWTCSIWEGLSMGPGSLGEGSSWRGRSQATARTAMQGDLQILLPTLGIHLDPRNFVWHLSPDSHLHQ